MERQERTGKKATQIPSENTRDMAKASQNVIQYNHMVDKAGKSDIKTATKLCMFVLSVETEAAIRNDFIVKKQKL
jgi:formiminotetrahydrofolate cyclodeaminase